MANNFCSNCGKRLEPGEEQCSVCYPRIIIPAAPAANAAMAAVEEEIQAAPVWEPKTEQTGDYTAEMQRLLAEEERRQKAEESRRWAEEERARRQAAEAQTTALTGSFDAGNSDRTGEAAGDYYAGMNHSVDFGSAEVNYKVKKALMCASYFSKLPFFWLTNYVCHQDSVARFHAKEGAKLFIAHYLFVGAGALTGIGLLGVLGNIIGVVGLFSGISNVLHGRQEKLPVIDRMTFLDDIAEKIVDITNPKSK